MMSSTTNPTELKRNLIAVFGTGIVLFLFPLFYLNYLGFLNSYFYVGSPLFYLVLVFLVCFAAFAVLASVFFQSGKSRRAQAMALCFLFLASIPFLVTCDGEVIRDTVTRRPVPIHNLSLGMHDDGDAFITGDVTFEPELGGEEKHFDSDRMLVNYDYAYINQPMISIVDYAEAYNFPLIHYNTPWRCSTYSYLLLIPEP